MRKSITDVFLGLLSNALWGTTYELKNKTWNHVQFQAMMSIAKKQALAGLISQALMNLDIRLEKQDAMKLFALQRNIRQRNKEMDKAVVELCQEMARRNIRIFVMKGQTLSRLYSDPGLRQSGDIDFLCYPDDWDKAVGYFKDELKLDITDNTTEKHISFQMNGVEYELHRMMTAFASPSHIRYWDETVMPEIWSSLCKVKIEEYDVPTLSSLHNALYVFVHAFVHLLDEGVGLRQFCDWAKTLEVLPRDEELVERLRNHLEKLGLLNAYLGLGAILTDYLGFPKENFPFEIPEKEHKRAEKLFRNIMEMGNFGHNKRYVKNHGVIHGVQHLGRITLQARRFYHYAPAEAWWRVPYLFKWWGVKIGRKMLGIIGKKTV